MARPSNGRQRILGPATPTLNFRQGGQPHRTLRSSRFPLPPARNRRCRAVIRPTPFWSWGACCSSNERSDDVGGVTIE
jgi:hypothetical protein